MITFYMITGKEKPFIDCEFNNVGVLIDTTIIKLTDSLSDYYDPEFYRWYTRCKKLKDYYYIHQLTLLRTHDISSEYSFMYALNYYNDYIKNTYPEKFI